jgi:hypothetical protein
MMEEYLRLREIASNVACMVHRDALGVDGRASSIIINKRKREIRISQLGNPNP